MAFKPGDKGNFGLLCLVRSRARHLVCFPSKMKGRPNGVAIFKGVGSLRGQSPSLDSSRGHPKNGG